MPAERPEYPRRVIHSATSWGVRVPSRKPFQGEGVSSLRDNGGIEPSRRMCGNPSDAIRALIASTPSRSIHALVAVLSDGLDSTWCLWPIINLRHEVYEKSEKNSVYVIPFWQSWKRADVDAGVFEYQKLWPLYLNES